MTLALATSLVERGTADAEHISLKYAEFYEPRRGYGAAAHHVMRALQSGADCRQTGRSQFPQGSFGNGGVMRIAPVGLAYRHAPDDVLRRAVEAALLCTHVHPEAIDAAFVQAKAVALAATASTTQLDPRQLIQTVLDLSEEFVVGRKLEILLEKLEEDAGDEEVVLTVGNGIRASEAIAAALWAFARYGRRPEECIIRAVGFGGDTDTIGAIVGAEVGSLHGSGWIPGRWYDQIENRRLGRDDIVGLAQRLAGLDLVSAE
jgi:poly(ADP-ribose) glycohydrolase ARH3